MSIDIVVAITSNNGIGYQGKLLIRNKVDMKRFKELTINSSCLMGKNTWNEIALHKPLIDRENIILTRDENFKVDSKLHNDYHITIRHNAIDVIEEFKRNNKRLCVIGGGELFRQALPYVDRVFLTVFDKELEADTYFPFEYVIEHFKEIERESVEVDGLVMEFITYVRKEDI